jgi:lincosamide nucleotidyltransferase A/C/D/E
VRRTELGPETTTHAVTDTDVIEIYDLMQSNGVTLWIDGGWGVDALLGRQTRRHKDLDVAVQAKDVPDLCELLAQSGFREKGEDYARPWNYILIGDAGREIDLHIIELDSEGNGVYGGDRGESYTAHALSGRGTIGGRDVHCIAAEDSVRFHSGYKLKDKDFRDVSALCDAFGIELPAEYRHFVAGEPESRRAGDWRG